MLHPRHARKAGEAGVTSFDVLTMGRIGVDLYPMQTGVGLEEVTTFGKWLGGSATNVAVAAARYGRRAAVISRTGEDPFGRFVHAALRGYGVDDRYVTPVPGLPMAAFRESCVFWVTGTGLSAEPSRAATLAA